MYNLCTPVRTVYLLLVLSSVFLGRPPRLCNGLVSGFDTFTGSSHACSVRLRFLLFWGVCGSSCSTATRAFREAAGLVVSGSEGGVVLSGRLKNLPRLVCFFGVSVLDCKVPPTSCLLAAVSKGPSAWPGPSPAAAMAAATMTVRLTAALRQRTASTTCHKHKLRWQRKEAVVIQNFQVDADAGSFIMSVHGLMFRVGFSVWQAVCPSGSNGVNK